MLPTFNELASSSPKKKSESCTIVLITRSSGVTSIKIVSLFRPTYIKREMLRFFFCSYGPTFWEILGKGETVDSTLFRMQLEERVARIPASHKRQGKILLLMDNACENHPEKAEGPRDGVDAPSTLFPGRFFIRFFKISKPGKLLPRAALQELQGRGVQLLT